MKFVLSLTVADEAEKPSLKVLTNLVHGLLICNVDETKAIFCEGHNIKQKPEWISPSGEPVGRKSSNKRIYAEHRVNQTHLLGLFLKNLTIKDGGNWTCRSGDELSQTITLYVAEKVNITVKEVNVVGDEDKSIKLICDAKGFPEPVIQWYRDNTIIDADPTKYIIKQKKDRTQHILEILSLTHLDPGTYTCRATQEKISHFDQKLFHLSVRHKPLILNEFSEKEVYAIMNEIKNITCRAQANPAPIFSWSKRNEERYDLLLANDQVYMSEDGTYSVLMLKVYNEDDLGQYKCSVENDRGRQNFIFDVSLGNKPNPPTSVKAVDIKAFNITFNVTCETCLFNVEGEMAANPNNLTVLGFNFQLVPCKEGIAVPYWENATEFVFNIDNTTETLFTVSPLVNATEYHARVATRNAAGLSDWLPVHPNPKTLDKNNVAALTVSLSLLIVTFFTTLCY
ncbi:hypothetical protein MSG28_006411 [Choristoneura fumiferana]|uniref:Uncharacterized protein n=1 Tax=Choristoneura fumiferana TaxID=7141 RepID=A0ACC0JEQ7_CHOFU|nr:hypothetical protein MSG28_006411 [Choristoneura fumiferana]